MGDTTSNQNRAIATMGTPHVARTLGATDAHLDPEAPADPQLFPNEVPMSLLTPGTSQTLIAGQPVWTAAHQLGPESGPIHPPYTMGAISGTYLQEAVATSHSADVIVEGGGVVRSFDTTTQNHGNTTGMVDGGMIDAATAPDEAFLLRMCAIVELQGVNVAEVSPPAGVTTGAPTAARPLGYPGAPIDGQPPFYLEILSGSPITFTAVRQDLTQPGAAATCFRAGIHTQWAVARTGGSGWTIAAEGTDTFELGGGFTALQLGEDQSGFAWTGPELNDDGEGRQNDTISAGGRQYNMGSEGVVSSVEAVFALLGYKQSPVEGYLAAYSCGATRIARFPIFPAQRVDMRVWLEQQESQVSGRAARLVGDIRNALGVLRQVGDVVKRVGELAQVQVEIELCREAFVAAQVGYVPCGETRTSPFGKLYTPSHVGLAWRLELGAAVLVGFEVEIKVSILNFIVPALGQVVADAIRFLGVAADLVLEASLSVPLSVSVGCDEYEWPTNTGATIAISPALAMGFDVAVFVQWVTFRAHFPCTLQAAFHLGDRPGALLQLTPSGDLTPSVEVILLEYTWFEATYSADIDFLRVHWEGTTLDVITTS